MLYGIPDEVPLARPTCQDLTVGTVGRYTQWTVDCFGTSTAKAFTRVYKTKVRAIKGKMDVSV
jgi:hypothetical protein